MEKLKKSLLLFLVLALSIVLLAGCGDDDDDSSSSKKKKNNTAENNTTSITSKESALDKVETEALGITAGGDYIIKLKNTNNKDVYIEYVTVNFFDNNGTFAESCNASDSYFCIPANKEIITYLYGSSSHDYSKYTKSEIELSTGEPFYEYRTNLDATFNNTGSQIAATVTNNTDIDLDSVEVNVVFYKDGKIVGIKNGSSNYGTKISKDGGNAYINIYYPYDNNYNDVEFDNFEGYVVSAYAHNN